MLEKSNGDKFIRKGIIALIYSLLICLLITDILALPPLPSQFYGHVLINGIKAPIGTDISAYDIDNIKCSLITTQEVGRYILSCKGDNLNTGIDEGARPQDKITIYINNVTAKTSNAAIWKAGSFNEINISINSSTDTIRLSPQAHSYYLYIFYGVIILIIILLFVLIIRTKRGRRT